MKKQILAALFAGALSIVPGAAFAASQSTAPKTPPATAKQPSATPVMHAMKGTVKSIDDHTLVLTGSGGNHAEMTFALNGSTRREGTIATGTPVSVRYHDDGKTHVATAIHAEKPGKQAKK